jgi:hypothetical protein
MLKSAERAYYLMSGAFLILGSMVFLWGGSQHPHIRQGAGDLEYFQGFAHRIVHHPNWEGIHSGILAGPVLWLLGMVALCGLLRRADETRWSGLGLTALTLAAACWSVTFVFDGFVVPNLAKSLLDATDPAQAALALAGMRANQTVVIRLGLVSWIVLGIATAAFSIALAAAPIVRGAVRWPLVALGLILGVWPAVAAVSVFQPGPFVSPLWNPTAILTAFWYLAVGVLVMSTKEAGEVACAPLPLQTPIAA